MTQTVNCVVLLKEAEALDRAPWPGALGERILKEVSREGWQRWLAQQTILMNEQRLSPINPDHRAYLESEMEAFLFGDGGKTPAGWIDPNADKS